MTYGDQEFPFGDEPDIRLSPAELDDVFDDPEHGDPGMDRMGVHLTWELLLLIATAAVAWYLFDTQHAAVTGASLRALLVAAAALGFLAVGVGLSLRAGVVNLAAGSVSAAAALFFAGHADRGVAPAAGVTVMLAAAVGAVIGLAVVILQVPSWAASLAAVLGITVWVNRHGRPIPVVASYHPDRQAFYWYGGFVALALLGGLLGLAKPIRRGVGRFRPVADPALRRGGLAAGMAFVALVASAALAGLAGVLTALDAGTVAPSDGLLPAGLAIGAALTAGTSAFGRRGGVVGTVLSVSLISLVMAWSDAADLRISRYAVAAVAVGAGLVLTRLVESYGRPRPVRRAEPDTVSWATGGTRTAADPAGGQGWSASGQDGWTSQLPARSTDDTWGGASDERWGVK